MMQHVPTLAPTHVALSAVQAWMHQSQHLHVQQHAQGAPRPMEATTGGFGRGRPAVTAAPTGRPPLPWSAPGPLPPSGVPGVPTAQFGMPVASMYRAGQDIPQQQAQQRQHAVPNTNDAGSAGRAWQGGSVTSVATSRWQRKAAIHNDVTMQQRCTHDDRADHDGKKVGKKQKKGKKQRGSEGWEAVQNSGVAATRDAKPLEAVQATSSTIACGGAMQQSCAWASGSAFGPRGSLTALNGQAIKKMDPAVLRAKYRAALQTLNATMGVVRQVRSVERHPLIADTARVYTSMERPSRSGKKGRGGRTSRIAGARRGVDDATSERRWGTCEDVLLFYVRTSGQVNWNHVRPPSLLVTAFFAAFKAYFEGVLLVCEQLAQGASGTNADAPHDIQTGTGCMQNKAKKASGAAENGQQKSARMRTKGAVGEKGEAVIQELVATADDVSVACMETALPALEAERDDLLSRLDKIRTDLLVQDVTDAFCVMVYEWNIRVALACDAKDKLSQPCSILLELYSKVPLSEALLIGVEPCMFFPMTMSSHYESASQGEASAEKPRSRASAERDPAYQKDVELVTQLCDASTATVYRRHHSSELTLWNRLMFVAVRIMSILYLSKGEWVRKKEEVFDVLNSYANLCDTHKMGHKGAIIVTMQRALRYLYAGDYPSVVRLISGTTTMLRSCINMLRIYLYPQVLHVLERGTCVRRPSQALEEAQRRLTECEAKGPRKKLRAAERQVEQLTQETQAAMVICKAEAKKICTMVPLGTRS